MYSLPYKSAAKTGIRKNRFNKKNKGLFGGFIRFVKLTAIIASIVPVLYLADVVYGFINRSLDSSQFDNYLKIKSVKVKGNNFVAEEELAEEIKEIRNHNILRIDMNDFVSRIRKHRWIKDVSVRRELPDTLLVEISERTPALYVNNKGTLYLADEDGVIIDSNKTDNLLDLPVVYGVDLPGNIARNSDPVKDLLPAIEVKKEIASLPWIALSSTGIEVYRKNQIVLHLKGYKIKLGRGDYQQKLLRFQEIAGNLQDKGISYKEVDLRFGNEVIVKTVKTI